MVKVVSPNAPLSLFQTTGNALILRERKEGFTVSKSFVSRNQPEESQEIVRLVGEARRGEWEGLSGPARTAWDTLALENYQTGFQLFMQEGWKRYLQSIYGYARYNQQVYLP